jgi:hypothetical protein
MSVLDLFLPLAKVDLDRRLVTGVATAETRSLWRDFRLRLKQALIREMVG